MHVISFDHVPERVCESVSHTPGPRSRAQRTIGLVRECG
ncbi:hypothetical protein FM104_05295 [Microbacterium esteraromaticum]|uniref:Uncharacterized protein n=1 Tax=Microbacterium esteraromaticum TaxID=57043 RepID=A0A1R4J350_9MICO|nr:hypothetical protein FM104_05295 [Microbacterium esteraromaticum]